MQIRNSATRPERVESGGVIPGLKIQIPEAISSETLLTAKSTWSQTQLDNA